jgi:hypothetical protein
MSYASLYGIALDRDHHADFIVGDLVQTSANSHPRFTILAIDNGRAWLRDFDQPWKDGIVPLERCRHPTP